MAATACAGFLQPLNLECILINVFAGSLDLFIFIAFIVVAMMCAKFKMRNGPALLMFAMFAIIFSTYMPGLYILIIIVGGMSIFFGLKAPFSRD